MASNSLSMITIKGTKRWSSPQLRSPNSASFMLRSFVIPSSYCKGWSWRRSSLEIRERYSVRITAPQRRNNGPAKIDPLRDPWSVYSSIQFHLLKNDNLRYRSDHWNFNSNVYQLLPIQVACIQSCVRTKSLQQARSQLLRINLIYRMLWGPWMYGVLMGNGLTIISGGISGSVFNLDGVSSQLSEELQPRDMTHDSRARSWATMVNKLVNWSSSSNCQTLADCAEDTA